MLSINNKRKAHNFVNSLLLKVKKTTSSNLSVTIKPSIKSVHCHDTDSMVFMSNYITYVILDRSTGMLLICLNLVTGGRCFHEEGI